MPHLPPLTFRIAKLWGSPQGTVENQSFDEDVSYLTEENLNFSSNLVAEFMFIRMKDEVSVTMSDATVRVSLTCASCLKKFSQKIKIESAEREFFEELPSLVDDPHEVFLINKKAMVIDLSEMVRQEIILHFPFIPVCSKSCKGLCMHCGMDRNKEKCACKESSPGTQKPFKDLKQLLS